MRKGLESTSLVDPDGPLEIEDEEWGGGVFLDRPLHREGLALLKTLYNLKDLSQSTLADLFAGLDGDLNGR